jgi:hypothetical protein
MGSTVFRARFIRTAGLTLAIAAFGSSSAIAEPADLRTPDAIDAGKPAGVQTTPSDVRTPDAIDAGQPANQTPGLEARTPDARDHAEGRGTFSAPEVTVIKVTDPSPVFTGFDWSDAGIGAGGLLGLILVAVGGTMALSHGRHGHTRCRPAERHPGSRRITRAPPPAGLAAFPRVGATQPARPRSALLRPACCPLECGKLRRPARASSRIGAALRWPSPAQLECCRSEGS